MAFRDNGASGSERRAICDDPPMKSKTLPRLLAAFLAAFLASCASDYTLLTTDDQNVRTQQTNYYAFNHAFTDKAEAAVRAKAEELCAKRKLLAVRTSRACTLKSCMTNYQCMDAEAAKSYAP